ncbi:MAG: SGNH/GDSL hydrolase family protein [Prevotella sp.]|nr:SGNH/GDSL hydrolase family protein [Prevotella sp.]
MRKSFFCIVLLFSCVVTASAQGKPSVTIFGDSYSTFEGYITPDSMETWYFDRKDDVRRTDVSSVRETWWWQVIKRMNWKLEVNNSWSGATICNTGYSDADYTHRSFITRHKSLGTPDVILLLGATNDAWCDAPIGEYKYEGWRRADLYTFRPALAYLLSHMQDRYPTASIVYILNCDLKESINTSVTDICQHYDVPVIRLSGIDKTAGHPNVKGMQQIADQVVAGLKELKIGK